MTIGTDKDCHLVSKAFEAALFELERLSERSGPIPVKSAVQEAVDEPVVRGSESGRSASYGALQHRRRLR
jgi:hypothetical protein